MVIFKWMCWSVKEFIMLNIYWIWNMIWYTKHGIYGIKMAFWSGVNYLIFFCLNVFNNVFIIAHQTQIFIYLIIFFLFKKKIIWNFFFFTITSKWSIWSVKPYPLLSQELKPPFKIDMSSWPRTRITHQALGASKKPCGDRS